MTWRHYENGRYDRWLKACRLNPGATMAITSDYSRAMLFGFDVINGRAMTLAAGKPANDNACFEVLT